MSTTGSVGATGGISNSLLQSVTATATPGGLAPNQTVNQTQFLQLFVAQLQNQDPLSPLEPDQLTAELAQFSQLEQLTGVNDRLDKLATSTKEATSSTLLNLLGKKIAFDGGKLDVKDGKAPDVTYTVTTAANEVTATVRGADGTVVRVVDLGAQGTGQQTFSFDGKDAAGRTLAYGSYTLEIDATLPGQNAPSPLSLVTQATVDGVDLGSDPPAVLVGDQRVPIDQVQIVHGDS